MLQLDTEHLPVEQAEHHRQNQQRAEVADEHPVAQRRARLGQQAVGKPDEAPAHSAEDHIDVGEVLFHRFVRGSFGFLHSSDQIRPALRE